MQKILSMIGMCKKAGKLASGSFVCENYVKKNKAKLIIVAEDASLNTKKLFNDKCTFYKVPFCYFASKDEIGKYIGKNNVAVIAITDTNFANIIQKMVLEANK